MDKQDIITNIFPKVIAIHLTNYFPKDGIIKTRYYTRPSTWLRDTIHFTLNHAVQNLSVDSAGRSSSWSDSKFALLIPFDLLFQINGNNLQNFSGIDTFFVGNVIIPQNSTILVFPSGIEEIIKNQIISKEEIAKLIKTIQLQGYITKKYNQINLKIFLPINKREYNLKDLINAEITSLDYKLNLNLNFKEINNTLNLPGGPHDIHWTNSLEDFGELILGLEEEINNFILLILRLRNMGYFFPIFKTQFDERDILILGEEGNYFDLKGKPFDAKLIYSFPKNEQYALKLFRDSYNDLKNNRNKLQSPFERAIELKRKIPQNYHKDITSWIEKHKANVRKIPQPLITMCPRLKELLEQEY